MMSASTKQHLVEEYYITCVQVTKYDFGSKLAIGSLECRTLALYIVQYLNVFFYIYILFTYDLRRPGYP